ncbi:hydratase [Agarivorans sp. DSG3-1]|uniref:hydratase n=1 Tax=Agarivorans sp. DSG3-1 TaxID=3342249 RepID=UPI00398F7705
MNKDTSLQAAKVLLSNRNTDQKVARLAPELRPHTIDDALEIQAAMAELRQDKIGGWKCLLPPAEDKVIVAPIFTADVQSGIHCELMADTGIAKIEPEIAFVLAKDLPAQAEDYSEAQINDAIGDCHMALELIQRRFADSEEAAFLEVLADGLVNRGLYLGPKLDKAKAFAASSIQLSLSQNDNKQSFEGKHPNQHPVSPIYWLINFMSKRGVSFKAGEALITGSYAGIVELEFDVDTLIEYQDLGAYQVKLVKAQAS